MAARQCLYVMLLFTLESCHSNEYNYYAQQNYPGHAASQQQAYGQEHSYYQQPHQGHYQQSEQYQHGQYPQHQQEQNPYYQQQQETAQQQQQHHYYYQQQGAAEQQQPHYYQQQDAAQQQQHPYYQQQDAAQQQQHQYYQQQQDAAQQQQHPYYQQQDAAQQQQHHYYQQQQDAAQQQNPYYQQQDAAQQQQHHYYQQQQDAAEQQNPYYQQQDASQQQQHHYYQQQDAEQQQQSYYYQQHPYYQQQETEQQQHQQQETAQQHHQQQETAQQHHTQYQQQHQQQETAQQQHPQYQQQHQQQETAQQQHPQYQQQETAQQQQPRYQQQQESQNQQAHNPAHSASGGSRNQPQHAPNKGVAGGARQHHNQQTRPGINRGNPSAGRNWQPKHTGRPPPDDTGIWGSLQKLWQKIAEYVMPSQRTHGGRHKKSEFLFPQTSNRTESLRSNRSVLESTNGRRGADGKRAKSTPEIFERSEISKDVTSEATTSTRRMNDQLPPAIRRHKRAAILPDVSQFRRETGSDAKSKLQDIQKRHKIWNGYNKWLQMIEHPSRQARSGFSRNPSILNGIEDRPDFLQSLKILKHDIDELDTLLKSKSSLRKQRDEIKKGIDKVLDMKKEVEDIYEKDPVKNTWVSEHKTDTENNDTETEYISEVKYSNDEEKAKMEEALSSGKTKITTTFLPEEPIASSTAAENVLGKGRNYNENFLHPVQNNAALSNKNPSETVQFKQPQDASNMIQIDRQKSYGQPPVLSHGYNQNENLNSEAELSNGPGKLFSEPEVSTRTIFFQKSVDGGDETIKIVERVKKVRLEFDNTRPESDDRQQIFNNLTKAIEKSLANHSIPIENNRSARILEKTLTERMATLQHRSHPDTGLESKNSLIRPAVADQHSSYRDLRDTANDTFHKAFDDAMLSFLQRFESSKDMNQKPARENTLPNELFRNLEKQNDLSVRESSAAAEGLSNVKKSAEENTQSKIKHNERKEKRTKTSRGRKTVGEKISDAYEASKETASNLYDASKETASNLYDKGKETASNLYDASKETASKVYDASKNTVNAGLEKLGLQKRGSDKDATMNRKDNNEDEVEKLILKHLRELKDPVLREYSSRTRNKKDRKRYNLRKSRKNAHRKHHATTKTPEKIEMKIHYVKFHGTKAPHVINVAHPTTDA